jgi:Predicted integral membrane protein (DUF2269)
MLWLLPWLLFLHVLAAVVAFGPTFSYSLIGTMAAKEPQHANFATMPVTGVAMILVAGFNLTARQYLWLDAAIIVYVVVLAYGVLVQRRTVERLVELTSAPPPPGAAGPPPEVPATVRRVQLGGMFMGAGIVLILFLMVVKPGFGG